MNPGAWLLRERPWFRSFEVGRPTTCFQPMFVVRGLWIFLKCPKNCDLLTKNSTMNLLREFVNGLIRCCPIHARALTNLDMTHRRFENSSRAKALLRCGQSEPRPTSRWPRRTSWSSGRWRCEPEDLN